MPRERFGSIFIPSKQISAYTRMTTSYMPGTRHKRVDIAGTGFTVLDRIYADGHFTEEALGGSCGNVFLSLAMLHWRVAPVLALGMDETGRKTRRSVYRRRSRNPVYQPPSRFAIPRPHAGTRYLIRTSLVPIQVSGHRRESTPIPPNRRGRCPYRPNRRWRLAPSFYTDRLSDQYFDGDEDRSNSSGAIVILRTIGHRARRTIREVHFPW